MTRRSAHARQRAGPRPVRDRPIAIEERPEHAPEEYEHDFNRVDGAVREAFDRFHVWRVYIDPQYIEQLVDLWQGRWGDDRVHKWYTSRPTQMGHAVRSHRQSVGGGDLSHDGDPTFAKHVSNARKQKVNTYDEHRRPLFTLSKDRPHSPNKMDAAIASVLSWEARGDAIASGASGGSVYEIRGILVVYRPAARGVSGALAFDRDVPDRPGSRIGRAKHWPSAR